MSRRPPKPAPVVVKRSPEERRKLPPELEAFARSDDEKLRIRRPRVDQGRVRDPREGYTVAGVANRDARAVYDVRSEAMRALWDGGAADEEALRELGRLLHDARRLELWRARRLTGFDAFAEEVVGVPAAQAEELVAAHTRESGESPAPLTERSAALWLRTEAGLYEGDVEARARIRTIEGTQWLELEVALVHASTALAGAGARHLPLARGGQEGERRFDRDTRTASRRDDSFDESREQGRRFAAPVAPSAEAAFDERGQAEHDDEGDVDLAVDDEHDLAALEAADGAHDVDAAEDGDMLEEHEGQGADAADDGEDAHHGDEPEERAEAHDDVDEHVDEHGEHAAPTSGEPVPASAALNGPRGGHGGEAREGQGGAKLLTRKRDAHASRDGEAPRFERGPFAGENSWGGRRSGGFGERNEGRAHGAEQGRGAGQRGGERGDTRGFAGRGARDGGGAPRGPREGGGFGRGPREGGFGRGPREGGFSNGPREGGFGRGPREGGFGRGPREGGFARPAREGGGFGRGPRDGAGGGRGDGREGRFERKGSDRAPDNFAGRRDDRPRGQGERFGRERPFNRDERSGERGFRRDDRGEARGRSFGRDERPGQEARGERPFRREERPFGQREQRGFGGDRRGPPGKFGANKGGKPGGSQGAGGGFGDKRFGAGKRFGGQGGQGKGFGARKPFERGGKEGAPARKPSDRDDDTD